MPASPSNVRYDLILAVSAALQFALFVAWPGAPDGDVMHSIFAAHNLTATGALTSINLYPPPSSDLSVLARTYWMTHWPPAQSLLYAPLLAAGLSAGAATKALAVACVMLAGLGWIRLGRALGGSLAFLAIVAAASPWIFFFARIYVDYKNDHLVCALAPWVALRLLAMAPSPAAVSHLQRVLTGLLIGLLVVIKYSDAPTLAAGGLFALWLEWRAGGLMKPASVVRLAVLAAAMAAPGLALAAVNHLWGLGSYPLQSGGGAPFKPATSLVDVVTGLAGAPTGWSHLVTELDLGLKAVGRTGLPHGALFAVSAVVLALWVAWFVRARPSGPPGRLLVFLVLLTAIQLAFLEVLSLVSGIKYDFLSDGRFYQPGGETWVLLGAASLDRTPWMRLVRSPRFYSLAIPLGFGLVYYAHEGPAGARYATMPLSGVFWDYRDTDPTHAAFLAQLKKAEGHAPALIVTPSPNAMVELERPFYWRYANHNGDFYSSSPIEVWAMIPPADDAVFHVRFRRAASCDSVQTPPGFPYEVYILRFTPNGGASAAPGRPPGCHAG